MATKSPTNRTLTVEQIAAEIASLTPARQAKVAVLIECAETYQAQGMNSYQMVERLKEIAAALDTIPDLEFGVMGVNHE